MTHANTGKLSFSQLNDTVVSLSVINPSGGALEACCLSFATLFDCSEDVPFPEISHGGPIERLYRFLNDYKDKERNITLSTKLRTAENEGQVSEIVARDVIKPLAGDFIIGRDTFARWKNKEERVTVKTLGLGQPEIWHGYLDLVAVPLALESESTVPLALEPESTVPVSVVSVDNDQLSINVVDQQASDSEADENCCIEVKKDNVTKCIEQIIGETVCFSFVLQNKNKDQTKSMVPGLVMSSSRFLVVLYDCKNDVLLVSDPMTWMGEEEVYRSGIIALWVVLHHGKYLKDLAPELLDDHGLRSSFHEIAQSQNLLETYKKLSSYEEANVSRKAHDSLQGILRCHILPPGVWYVKEESSPKKHKS